MSLRKAGINGKKGKGGPAEDPYLIIHEAHYFLPYGD
jgi:hypothetical protein